MTALTPFHLAIPVRNIGEARDFHAGLLECPEGRSSTHWADFNLFGHQLVCHQVVGHQVSGAAPVAHNPVDGDNVPIPHFGVVLQMAQWRELAAKLSAAGVIFVIEPHVRFAGEAGEQATMFFSDPSGNFLEFKAFQDINDELFKRQ